MRPGNVNNHRRQALIYACFFLSGTAGLIYEVVWARQLGLFLGITSYAHTAVIAAYMLGLALGSWLLGRGSDRFLNPLRFYAWLELVIALFAATTPWLFEFLQSAYASWAGIAGVTGNSAHLTRFAIALAALLLPTFLMGGTLPLLVRGVVHSLPQLGAVTGRLYGLNTLGATLGTALAGFVLLPWLGVVNTIFCGVVINIGIALVILSLPRAVVAPQTARTLKDDTVMDTPALTSALTPELTPVLTMGQRVFLLTGFAAAGFAALLIQLAWIRSMVLVVGGSVYAFSITLTSFLAGIGMGSLIYSRWLSRRQLPDERFALAASLAFFAGLAILLGLLVIVRLPRWFLQGYDAGWVDDFATYQVFIFALSLAPMILPTLLMGALFPLLAVTWTRSQESAGRGIGSAYAVNTLGTIFGALLGGLVLLPSLGIQHSIILAAGIYVAAAIGFWLAAHHPRPLTTAVAVSVFLLAAYLLPSWDRMMMARGIYYEPQQYVEGLHDGDLEGVVRAEPLLYYGEGLEGTVSVVQEEVQRALRINGKVDASSESDLQSQVSAGQLAALIHPKPRNALLIGLGSGVTAGALLTHRSIGELTVLEMSPQVVEASAFFADTNRHALEDSRLKLVSADARNYVLAARQQWDLIVSEPSNPWISGVSNLFTEDFFRLAKTRLAPGGIMTQWFHSYSVTAEDVKSVLHAFSSNYAYVTIWHMQYGDLFLLGSDQPYFLDQQKLQAALADPVIGPDLRRANLGTPRELYRHFLASGGSLTDYLAGAITNSDRRPHIEFSAPRSLYAGWTDAGLLDIARILNGQKFALPLQNQVASDRSGITNTAMGLQVRALLETPQENLQAWWWVWREASWRTPAPTPDIGDLREMSWSEGGLPIQVQLEQFDFSPDLDVRARELYAQLKLPVVAGGMLDKSGDEHALWSLGANERADPGAGPAFGAGVIELALSWTCPLSEGAVNRFLVVAQLADPGEEAWPETLAAFASRFECLNLGSE
ncbi:MAG: hypothetical protein EXR85_00005 [Xanthomonadales bacterium]|nr:hypothetical protein [Xanthomonadales bacterium]